MIRRHRHLVAHCALLLSALAAGVFRAAPASAEFSPWTTGFTLRVHGEVNPYTTFGVFVLPEERLPLEVVSAPGDAAFRLEADAGAVLETGARRWIWRAPKAAGLYPLRIAHQGAADAMLLNVFVMVPYHAIRGEELKGYRIGSYPKKPFRGLPIYKPPRGFIEVTRENEATRVSPHFTLGQFLCKQQSEHNPKYLVLRERLLLKLEYLLGLVNRKGHAADTFVVMSGYRTPFYNREIGSAKHSRHLWGGAADIFIDVEPCDGVMDDLNADGHIDKRDADYLYDLIEAEHTRREYAPFIGGLGQYGTTPAHGPFVHIDVRGFRARW